AKLLPSVVLADEVPPELLPQQTAVYPPDAAGDGAEDGSRSSLLERLASHVQAAALPLALSAPLTWVWSRFLSGCHPRVAALPLEWHPRQPWLAAADERGRVQILDLGPCLPGRPTANGSAGHRQEVLAAGPGSLRAVLAHDVLSLSWCPTSPGLLAVGTAGGVCLWAVAGEGRPPLAVAGRAAGPWLRHLSTRVAGARVTAVSWSPDGRMLAAASPGQAGLQVWDVASGTPTTIGAGPSAFDTVRWSPCGNYLFTAGTGSRYFYIFETQRWRWARWQTAAASGAASGPGGAAAGPASAACSVVAAAWAPPASGRHPVLLAALSGQSYLVAVHLVEPPPGLAAQLLPVGLPDLQLLAEPAARDAGAAPAGRSDGPSSACSIADMAWDRLGERLAGGHCLALYSTITDPLVSARLLGFARPPRRLCAASAAALGAAATQEGDVAAAASG
ncbi:Aladin, partial [Tetrabaena socialis]